MLCFHYKDHQVNAVKTSFLFVTIKKEVCSQNLEFLELKLEVIAVTSRF
jgi:hypothetical protein